MCVYVCVYTCSDVYVCEACVKLCAVKRCATAKCRTVLQVKSYSNYDCETSATAKIARPSFSCWYYIQCIMTCGVSDLFIHEFCCTCTEELY